MILSQALSTAALKNPSNIALFDLGKGISYGEFRKQVGQLSYLFQAEVGHYQRVCFFTNNCPAVAKTFFALSNIGCISLFLDPNGNPEQVAKTLKDYEITHLAVTEDVKGRANEMMRNFNLSLPLIEIEKKKGGEYDPTYSAPPDKPLKETDTILILPTGGTTGDVHYASFTHKQVYQAASLVRKYYHLNATDKIMSSMNWAHPFSLVHGLLVPLLNGSTCAIDPQHRTQELIDYIAEYRINRFVGTPNFYFQLLFLCSSAKFPLPGVKSVTVGLGMLSTATKKTFALLKIPVIHVYGMAENVWTIAIEDGDTAEFKQETFLKPLPGVKYKVLDEAGDEVPGEGVRQGPLAVMAETVMNAYIGPEKEKKELERLTKQMKRGTWLYTGDMARLEGVDDEMKIVYLGRETDVKRIGKDCFRADAIDSVAQGIPGVEEAAGFLKGDAAGEIHFAVAVVKNTKGLGEKDVLEHCKANLKAELQPKYVYFLDTLPKDSAGNVNRFSLRRQFTGMD